MARAGQGQMQQYIQQETQKQQMQQVIHDLNEKCWDTCFEGKPGNKIDSRTETCITNCVERFIDTNIHLVQRFERTVNEKAAKLGYSEGM